MSLSSSSSWTLLTLLAFLLSLSSRSLHSLPLLFILRLQMAYSVVRVPSNFFPLSCCIHTLVLQWHHLCVCRSLKLFLSIHLSHSLVSRFPSFRSLLSFSFSFTHSFTRPVNFVLSPLFDCYSTSLFHSIDRSLMTTVSIIITKQLTNLQLTPLAAHTHTRTLT